MADVSNAGGPASDFCIGSQNEPAEIQNLTPKLFLMLAPLGFLGAGLIGIAASVRSLFVAGIGWDSSFDTYATSIARNIDGSYSLQQAYDAIPVTTEFYGLIIYQLADFFHSLFTGNSALLTAYDPMTYVWQGGVTLLLSVLAATALAFALWVAWRSTFVASFAWAALVTLPNWLGASTINYKDMPVASGLTMLSAALGIAAIQGFRRVTGTGLDKFWVTFVALITGGLGASIAVSTRAGSLFIVVGLMGFSIMVMGVASLYWRSLRLVMNTVYVVSIAALTPLAFIWLTNPVARISLPYWFKDSLDYSTGEFPWAVSMRTAGINVSSDSLTWWYIPAWLFARLPMLVIFLAGVGSVAAVAVLIRGKLRQGNVDRSSLLVLIPFVAQGLLIPLGLIVMQSTIYDEIRHLQFIYPAVISIGAFAVAIGTSLKGARIIPIASMAIAGVIVITNLYWVAQWFPYSYSYVNTVAKGQAGERHWDLDYWGVSAREGVEKLTSLGYEDIIVVPHGEPGRPYGGQNWGDPGGGVVDSGFSPTSGEPFSYYWFERFEFPFPEYDCQEQFVIERAGKTLGRGGVCTPT